MINTLVCFMTLFASIGEVEKTENTLVPIHRDVVKIKMLTQGCVLKFYAHTTLENSEIKNGETLKEGENSLGAMIISEIDTEQSICKLSLAETPQLKYKALCLSTPAMLQVIEITEAGNTRIYTIFFDGAGLLNDSVILCQARHSRYTAIFGDVFSEHYICVAGTPK